VYVCLTVEYACCGRAATKGRTPLAAGRGPRQGLIIIIIFFVPPVVKIPGVKNKDYYYYLLLLFIFWPTITKPQA